MKPDEPVTRTESGGANDAIGLEVNRPQSDLKATRILLAPPTRFHQAAQMKRPPTLGYPGSVTPARAGGHALCAQVFNEGSVQQTS